jgi:hypothetical protein
MSVAVGRGAGVAVGGGAGVAVGFQTAVRQPVVAAAYAARGRRTRCLAAR